MQAITVATVNPTYDWMANKARRTLEDVLDVRARDRRPKLPPPVAQSGRAGAGVEREAEARPVAKRRTRRGAPRPQAMRKRWSGIIRLHVSEGERIDPRGLGTQLV